MNDLMNSLPIPSGIILGALGIAAFSFAVSGPLVAGRTVSFSNWAGQCKAAIHAEIELDKPAPLSMPKMNCSKLLGIFGPEMQAVCRKYGNPDFDFGVLDQLNQQKKRLAEREQRRLDALASSAGSRCDCAATVVISQRVPWAIHSVSGRLITPPLVQNLQSELETALHSPRCLRKGRS